MNSQMFLKSDCDFCISSKCQLYTETSKVRTRQL